MRSADQPVACTAPSMALGGAAVIATATASASSQVARLTSTNIASPAAGHFAYSFSWALAAAAPASSASTARTVARTARFTGGDGGRRRRPARRMPDLRQMATYVLIPGAGGSAWYWHRVAPLLRDRGHDVVAVELPAGDDAAGLAEYADAVVEAIGDRRDLIVVAQSMGGFTGPIVCERVRVELLVLLNAMIGKPGESPGEWGAATGAAAAREEQAARDGRSLDDDPEMLDTFFHDVSPEVTAEAMAQDEPAQSDTPFAQPWALARWPDVLTRVLQGRDDRLFPVEFQRAIAEERLGITQDEMPGGHLLALSQPDELVERLEAYRAEAGVA